MIIGLDESPMGFSMPLFLPNFVVLSPKITVGLSSRQSPSSARFYSFLLEHLFMKLKIDIN